MLATQEVKRVVSVVGSCSEVAEPTVQPDLRAPGLLPRVASQRNRETGGGRISPSAMATPSNLDLRLHQCVNHRGPDLSDHEPAELGHGHPGGDPLPSSGGARERSGNLAEVQPIAAETDWARQRKIDASPERQGPTSASSNSAARRSSAEPRLFALEIKRTTHLREKILHLLKGCRRLDGPWTSSPKHAADHSGDALVFA